MFPTAAPLTIESSRWGVAYSSGVGGGPGITEAIGNKAKELCGCFVSIAVEKVKLDVYSEHIIAIGRTSLELNGMVRLERREGPNLHWKFEGEYEPLGDGFDFNVDLTRAGSASAATAIGWLGNAVGKIATFDLKATGPVAHLTRGLINCETFR
jgi:hypothetical protein